MKWMDADFWNREWQVERESSNGRRRENMDDAAWWDSRAPGFAANKGPMQENIIDAIMNSGCIHSDAEILDIGCGPGNYALRLAGMCKKVVVVDISPRMLSILEERAAEMGIKNIETVCSPWDKIDLDVLGWRRKFGLVLAIKTPGIFDRESLKKMSEASNCRCFFNNFVRREDEDIKHIWKLLFREEQPPNPADIFFVLHLLAAEGFLPSMQLYDFHREKDVDIPEAVQELLLMMTPHAEASDELTKLITDYVQGKSTEGRYVRARTSVEGNILWTV